MSNHEGGSYGTFKFGSRRCGDRDYPLPGTPTPTPTPGTTPTPTTPTPTVPTPTPTPATPPPPPSGSSGSDSALSGIPSLPPAINIGVDPFTSRAADYGLIQLIWRAPDSTQVQSLQLVRNTSGYAIDENDGVTLYSGSPNIGYFEDRSVQAGQEYYYTIFCKLPDANALLSSTTLFPDPGLAPGAGNVGYVPAATTRCVAVVDVDKDDAGNILMQYLPRVYTSYEHDAVGEIQDGTQLERFLQIFAFQVDKIKTSVQNLMPFHDAIHVQGPMVGPLTRMLGMPLENGLGIRQTRILARDAIHIYNHKGSTTGVNAFAKALTGVGAKTFAGPNILADTVDSSFAKLQIGRWSAASNCTLGTAVTPANVYTPPNPTTPAILLPGGLSPSSGAALMVTATSAGAMSVRHAGTNTTGWGVTVDPGATYAVSMAIQAQTTGRSVTLAIQWRDSAGTLIATSTQASGTTDSNTYQVVSYVAVAPTNAFFANLVVNWGNATIGEVHYVDAVMLEKLSIMVPDGSLELDDNANPWTLVTPPAPVQNLCTNPTFATNTSGWGAVAGFDGVTLSSSTDFAHSGSTSLKAQWATSTSGTSAVAYTASNLNPGQRYQFSLWAYVPSGSPAVSIAELSGAGSNYVVATQGTGTTKDAWVQLSVTFVAGTESTAAGTPGATMLLGVKLAEDSSVGTLAYLDDVSLVNLDYPFANQMSLDATLAESGKQSLKLQGFISTKDTYAYQTVPVIPGQSYNVSAAANVPIFNAGALGNRGLYVTDGVQVSNAGTPATTTTYTKVAPPPSGAYLGLYTPTNDVFATVGFETTFATSFDIVPFYADFSASGDSLWPTANMKAVYDGGSVSSTSGSGTITGGRVPLIRWESAAPTTGASMPTPGGSVTLSGTAQKAYTYAQILGGDTQIDAYINARATAVKTWGKPIMISFDHECDMFNFGTPTTTSAKRLAATGLPAAATIKGTWATNTAYAINDIVSSNNVLWRAIATVTASPSNVAPTEGSTWTQITSTQFASAFRYIKKKFDDAGVTNVTWVFSLSGQAGSNISACVLNDADYDWIAIDPYLKSTASTVAASWQAYVTRLDKGEAGTAGQTKPIMLAEWGVDTTYGSRTQAFTQVVTALQTGTLTRIKALCYFNGGADQLSSSPSSNTMGLIVPAFYDPYENSAWNKLINNPQGITWVIANDSNGRMADRHADPAYPQAIARARKAGLKIMFYVETHRANKSLSDVKADMDGWRRAYGQPDGWFFDQASTHASDINYYKSLYTYGGGGAGGKTIMINPGDTPDQAYMDGTGIFDIIGVAEDTAYEVRNWPWPTWQSSYDRSRMAVFTYRSRNLTADWNYIQSQNIGWTYIGDDNVFDDLPKFWSTEQQLAATTVSDYPGFKALASNAYLKIATANVVTITTQTSPAVVGQYTTITSTTSGWVQHLVTITPVTSSLQIRLYSPNGTVYWDDVAMARTTISPFSDARRADVLLFADRVNYVTNPNFESGTTTGWAVTPAAPFTGLSGYSSSTTMSIDTSTYYQGSKSLKVTHPTASKSGVSTTVYDLTPGTAYTVSARVLIPSGMPLVSIEHDAASFFLSGATASSVTPSVVVGTGGRQIGLTISEPANVAEYVYPELPGIFTVVTATFVATSSVHSVGFYAPATTSGQYFYLDQVMVEPSPELNDYFDGNILSADYMWEGPTNLSRSHYIRNLNTRSKRLAARLPGFLPAGVPYAVRLAWPGA